MNSSRQGKAGNQPSVLVLRACGEAGVRGGDSCGAMQVEKGACGGGGSVSRCFARRWNSVGRLTKGLVHFSRPDTRLGSGSGLRWVLVFVWGGLVSVTELGGAEFIEVNI